jgi:hypothetical protein
MSARAALVAPAVWAAAVGFQPSAWTIMPVDFGAPLTDLGDQSRPPMRGRRERR